MVLLSDAPPRESVGSTSYSALTLHRACPQAYTYRYLYRLSRPPQDDAKPELKFGTFWHALRAAEAVERGRRLGSLKQVPETIECADELPDLPTDREDLVGAVLEKADQFTKELPEEHREVWRKKLGTDNVAGLLRALDARYRKFYGEETPKERPVAVEVFWKRDLPLTGTTILGYVDEVYYDSERGLVVVRDHKTAKELGIMSTADDMMNSQLHLYAWGLKEQLAEWGLGPASAISYDRVNSVKPPQPRLTTQNKLSAVVKNFDLDTYLAFCEKHPSYKPEQAVIDRITSPAFLSRWFQRTLTPVNRNIARAHLQAAVDSDTDVRQTVERVQKRGFAARNFSGSACKWCDFASLCRAQLVGGPEGEYPLEDYGLVRRS